MQRKAAIMGRISVFDMVNLLRKEMIKTGESYHDGGAVATARHIEPSVKGTTWKVT
jgi:hypothetical protein